MRKIRNFIKKKLTCAGAIILSALLIPACGIESGNTNSNTISVTDEPEITAVPDTDGKNDIVSLQQFCNDPKLDKWFENLEEITPVKLEYWIYGEAPFGMDFTDPALILKTAKALQTVQIGDPSSENPDWVSDAGGAGYYFEMEDGTTIQFSFTMDCFKWNGDTYHDVADYGTLPEVNEQLLAIGNPQYIYVYAEDGGFYTEALETYYPIWKPEAAFSGGLYIYLDEENKIPYFEISRCSDETLDPEEYITEYLEGYMKEEFETRGASIEPADETRSYEISNKVLTGRHYTISEADGTSYTMFVLILPTKDSLLGEDHLIRFYAVYDDTVEGEEERVVNETEHAIDQFYLLKMQYEEKEVQPGNDLLDFCNDDSLRAWFEMAEKDLPDEMLCTQESWEVTDDPETIRQFLAALKTVKIGDLSEETVGGSERRIYDFNDLDKDTNMSFAFFADTFDWGSNSYEVLDWGDLLDLTEEIFGNDW